jgi:branched-chain amino acid transport system permease protein
MTEFFQLLVSGLAIGSVYGLVALGLVLILKSTDVFNFAQGVLLMLGSYLMVTALSLNLPLIPSMLIALALAGAIGLVIQQTVVRPMLGKPMLTVVMVTLALAQVIQALVIIIWGARERSFSSKLPDGIVDLWGVRLSVLDLTIMGIAFACLIGFAVFFQYSSVGLKMRATAENAEVAEMSGINTNRIFSLAFALGAALAAIGGILIANLQLVSLNLEEFGLLALPAAVIGGLQSIPGAVIGGLIVGVVGSLATGYVSGQVATPLSYSILLLMLLVRPYGLFGKPEVVRV